MKKFVVVVLVLNFITYQRKAKFSLLIKDRQKFSWITLFNIWYQFCNNFSLFFLKQNYYISKTNTLLWITIYENFPANFQDNKNTTFKSQDFGVIYSNLMGFHCHPSCNNKQRRLHEYIFQYKARLSKQQKWTLRRKPLLFIHVSRERVQISF